MPSHPQFTLLSLLLSDKLGDAALADTKTRSPEVEALRAKIRTEMTGSSNGAPKPATINVATLPAAKS